jgi:Ca-activated chloride channel homolog
VPRRGAAGAGTGRRGLSRRVKAGVLVVIAFVIAAACMIGLSAQAVVTRASCKSNPILLNVGVSTDIMPAIKTIAKGFNNQNHSSAGRCIEVRVISAVSSSVAGQVDGEGAAVPGLASIDAWIPDSSLWVQVARSYPQGAQTLQPTGITVARSPVMIVTTQAVASKMQAFDGPVGWNLLLPPSFGGPPPNLDLTVDLPDPTESAAGLAAIIEVSRQLGNSADARTAFTDFVNTSETTQDTDSAAALATFVSSSTSLRRRGVTVASEQAVLAYDEANPRNPLVARYPSGTSSALGSPELDYPFVLTTSARADVRAASEFGRFLQSQYAQAAVRYYGFRSANGVPDAMPSWAGLNSQGLQLASAFTTITAYNAMQVWKKLGLGSRDLVLTDVSPAMNQPDGIGSTLQEEVALASLGGLKLFPPTTHMGQWIMGQSKTQPYQQMVTLGGLYADVGLIPRIVQLADLDKTIKTQHGTLLLHEAILDAYKEMTLTYAPNDVNAVLVLTAGVDSPHDMPLSQLLGQLKALYNPSRKVEIVALMFGTSGNFTALEQIAAAAGGVAYRVANPAEIKQIFFEAWSHRLCNQGCQAP